MNKDYYIVAVQYEGNNEKELDIADYQMTRTEADNLRKELSVLPGVVNTYLVKQYEERTN